MSGVGKGCKEALKNIKQARHSNHCVCEGMSQLPIVCTSYASGRVAAMSRVCISCP